MLWRVSRPLRSRSRSTGELAVLQKIRKILGEEGVASVGLRATAFAYRRAIRPWLPNRPILYAGIPICHDRKWGDNIVPSSWLWTGVADRPDYEAALVAGLNESVRPGDRVVVVGGGLGVTAVIAALRAGPSGTIECFEGSKRYVKHVEDTARRNRVSNLAVHHAVISKSIAVYGDKIDEAVVMPPARLPPCDVLELDCEGAEVHILREMVIRPRVILVETHGIYGATTSLVDSLLRDRGYVVSPLGLAEPRYRDFCIQNDIRVLLAAKGDESLTSGQETRPVRRRHERA
jgi:hypothetical protein